MLDGERRAFTTWSEAPEREAHFVATKAQVIPNYDPRSLRDKAIVEAREMVPVILEKQASRSP